MLPLLVLVGGAPGTGKTMLASRLGEALGLPVLAKDDIKETLGDCLGAADVEQSRALGRATMAVLFLVVGRLLQSGVSVVCEAAFRRGMAEPDLRPLVARSRAVLVHCQTSDDVALRRYVERVESGQRHPCHRDAERLALVRSGMEVLSPTVYEPPDLGVPTLRIDTTDGYAPDFEAIVGFVRQVGAASVVERGAD